jgi:hypothetical protein
MALTERERKSILQRDGYQPQLPIFDGDKIIYGYCEEPKECKHLEVHHIVNQADGGTDEPKNLITTGKCIHVGVCPSGMILVRYKKP